MLGLSYGEILIIIGATAAVVGQCLYNRKLYQLLFDLCVLTTIRLGSERINRTILVLSECEFLI